MSLKAELNAVAKNYEELMRLPVKDLLPALKVVRPHVYSNLTVCTITTNITT